MYRTVYIIKKTLLHIIAVAHIQEGSDASEPLSRWDAQTLSKTLNIEVCDYKKPEDRGTQLR